MIKQYKLRRGKFGDSKHFTKVHSVKKMYNRNRIKEETEQELEEIYPVFSEKFELDFINK